MITLRALLYADARSFVNRLRDIRNAPARALIWVVFALAIVAMFGLRVIRASHRHAGTEASLMRGFVPLDLLVCSGVIVFGILLVNGARFGGLFANPAEARFIIASPADPFVATMYIQSRQIVFGGARFAFTILYIALVYLPAELPPGKVTADILLILTACLFIAAIPQARRLVPARFMPAVAVAGIIVIAAGALPVVRDLAALTASGAWLTARLPPLHPGFIMVAGTGAQALAMAIFLALTAALLAAVARTARDSYPELYELSMKRLARTERIRGAVFAPRANAVARTPVRSDTGRTPGGVAIFVWRAWTEYRRTTSARTTAIETGLCLVAGYAAARYAGVSDPKNVLVIAFPAISIAFILGVTRAASLANDLRRPLFWLSDATLFERLCALALAQSWRLCGWCVLAAAGLAAGHAILPLIAGVLVAAPLTILLATAIGYASYAVLPNDIDQRGPMRFFRLLLSYVLIAPPLAAGIVLAVIAQSPLLALFAASVLMLLEGAVLIGFAAWRLDRMSIALQ